MRLTRRIKSGSIRHKVTKLWANIAQTAFVSLIPEALDHLGFYVQRRNNSSRSAGCWNGKSSIAAAKLEQIALNAVTAKQPLNCTVCSEETVPEFFVGHSAFTTFHAVSLSLFN